MAVESSTKPESCWGISQGSPWLSAGDTGGPSGVGSGSEGRGWNDACVAALLFNIECNDSYVAAFLLNLRSRGRA